MGLPAALITARQAHYKGGISVIPSYLAKGLGFDAVVVAGASPEPYRLTVRDARLLYVVPYPGPAQAGWWWCFTPGRPLPCRRTWTRVSTPPWRPPVSVRFYI